MPKAGTKLEICYRHTAIWECLALQALLWPMCGGFCVTHCLSRRERRHPCSQG